MIKKYKEFQYNLAICTIVYTLFYKNKKKIFLFFLNLGTIGTN